MTNSIDPPGRPPSHCYGHPAGSCSKFRQSDGYTLAERKKGLRHIRELDIYLCQVCFRSYRKQKEQEKLYPVKPEKNGFLTGL